MKYIFTLFRSNTHTQTLILGLTYICGHYWDLKKTLTI